MQCVNFRASNKVRSARQRLKIYRKFLRIAFNVASYPLKYVWKNLAKYTQNVTFKIEITVLR